MSIDAQQLAALALDVLPQSAVIVDAAGKVLLRNRAAGEAFSEGNDLAELLQAVGGANLSWPQVLADSAESLEYRNVCFSARDNRQLTCDVYTRRLAPHDAGPDAGGPPRGAMLIVLQDVSARLSMERLLAGAERLSEAGKLSARVAHELNNPLDGILRYIGLAQRVGNDASQGYLDKARDGLMRMAGIIRDLMDRSRPWSSGGETTPVERLLGEAATAMEPRAQALGVSILTDSEDCQSVTVGGAMFQVFCNVIKNSLDAMPGGGLLSVRLRRSEQWCVMEFSDTGCGIPPELAGRVFEPFFTTKSSGEGTGLGLSICREIVTRMDGDISIGPNTPQGLKVIIRLPVDRNRSGKDPGPGAPQT